ncbi:MAG TPA: protein kinase [Gemmatimonadales bacterium]|nr:protein kinase [Gemmatimonadales bacterium]
MTLSPELDALAGERYLIERELGRGGMATVYLAHDRKHGRRVALKVLRPELSASLGTERFLREIRLAAGLQHPHILPIFDSGEASGREAGPVSLWYTMPYVEGPTLRDRIREQGRLPIDEAVRLVREVALALDHAHRRGVVHRDIKPENILLSEGQALVADFGIARPVETAHGDTLTQAGFVLGTPAYMSPEQAAGDTADARSDLYSLACVLYELLVGAQPFTGSSAHAVTLKRFTEAAPAVSAGRPDVPADLDGIVARALEREPDARYPTMAAFASTLAELGSARTTPSPAPPLPARSIAVLPFANIGGDPETEVFADGMAEELLNALVKATALRVASRVSSFAFKDRQEDVGAIALRLKVETVLEGSVRRAGNRIRVSAQLVDAAQGYHLWSERYDRELADVFAIQDEITASIVSALRLVLTAGERKAMAAERADVRAYEYYLRGRHLAHQVRREGYQGALRMFRQAVEIDPGYARAFAGIADCHSWMYMYYDASEENLRQADQASRRALELDAGSAEAHAARGFALSLGKQYDAARAELAAAIALAPSLYEGHYLFGRVCWAQGQLEEAARHFEDAATVRPEDPEAPSMLASAYEAINDAERAEAAHRRAVANTRAYLELYPADARALYHGALSLRRLGEEAEALAWAERARASAGEDSSAFYNLGCFYAIGGDIGQAFDCLNRAVDVGYAHREWVEHDVDLEPLHGDPRWEALLGRFTGKDR